MFRNQLPPMQNQIPHHQHPGHQPRFPHQHPMGRPRIDHRLPIQQGPQIIARPLQAVGIQQQVLPGQQVSKILCMCKVLGCFPKSSAWLQFRK